ncbi:MAG: TetR family transcriptional regulator [Symploca sp. SIO1A3]|nr:TetR family transcriptional regulator [Symploca sp. SIO2C1]NER45868.1 TetR family transcriptional regulator [Symploca sp. SIO1A3]
MNNSPLSSVLLPAVFVSSAVFSTLTIPFALIKSEPVVVELPFYSGEIQPIFNGQHKEVAIPYIGFAIVVSVGAGIATVEVNRRWQQSRKSSLTKDSSSHPQLFSGDKKIQPEVAKLPEYRPEADAAVAATATLTAINFSTNNEVFSNQSITDHNTTETATLIGIKTLSQVVTPQGTTSNQTTATSTISERLNLSEVPYENNSLDLGFNKIVKILESPQEYQTCRIKMPHLERHLFAIEVNGEYYSFFRALETREKVLELMAKLGSSVQKTAITKTPKSYVIWAWEPELPGEVIKSQRLLQYGQK